MDVRRELPLGLRPIATEEVDQVPSVAEAMALAALCDQLAARIRAQEALEHAADEGSSQV